MTLKALLITTITFTSLSAFAAKVPVTPKVIYGIDDRMDVYESSDNLMKELALSTAAQIMDRNLVVEGDVITIKAETLEESGICKSERFSQQPAAGNCSGFLVAPDKLVTAGHCLNSEFDCASHSWVFDYANTTEEKSEFKMNKSQVYKCTKIIERQKDSRTMADYAVLKLDRPVEGRTPLKYRKEGKPANDAVMTVIGHPTGLPTKITAAADMRSNTNPIFFVTNADTYGGNSGSAVVDSRTGVVEGILVRGDTDYSRSSEGCMVSVYRPQDGGRGEDVTRINIIKDLLK